VAGIFITINSRHRVLLILLTSFTQQNHGRLQICYLTVIGTKPAKAASEQEERRFVANSSGYAR